MTISISLCGDYTQSKSASLSSTDNTQISFTDIPVGAIIYTAAGNGGGLYLSGGSFTMTAASVKTNSAASGYTYFVEEEATIYINGEQIEGTMDYETGETTFLSDEDIELPGSNG